MTDTGTNVVDYLLDGHAPKSIALLDLPCTYSYGDLQSATDNVAAFLIRSGGRKGDRALLVADNGFFWVASYLGILRAGLVCVPLPPGISSEYLQQVVATTEPQFAMAQWRFALKHTGQLGTARLVLDADPPPGMTVRGISFTSLREKAAVTAVELPNVYNDDLAALMFTSGSEGKPRGVMVSHGNIIHNTESIIKYLKLTADDRILAVLPFHYCFGTSLLHTHLRVGGSLVVERRSIFPPIILKSLQETECTGFAGVPSNYQLLLRRSALARTRFPHLRYVQQAGGHLAPAFIRELRQALPGVEIYVMYGQTEATARLSYLPPNMLEQKLGSIGKAIPGVKLRVVSSKGEPVRPGEIGEIIARGDNIAQGYWCDPAESALCFRDGWLYTGDLATVDEDGFIYIADRAKDFLKCGGKRVSSRDIEDIILEYPEVVEAAVIGTPDDVLGEAAIAYVVPRDRKIGVSIPDLRAFCRAHLPSQYVPREIMVVESLPKNSAGKVLKSAIKTNGSAAVARFDG